LKSIKSLAVLTVVFPAAAQYAGPALLSRGEAPAAMSLPDIRFQPFIEASATYNTGLSSVTVTPAGQLATGSSYGTALNWGISGSHSWRHDRLGLSYRGGLTHYFSQKGYDSIDQSLMLGYTHDFSRHTVFTFRESAGLITRDFGLLNMPQTVPYDPSTHHIPTTDYFDNRTYYLSSYAGLTWQKSARVSMNFSGDTFITRRRSRALTGDSGMIARGDLQYRISRRITVGGGYFFTHYEFTRVDGGSDAHTAIGTFAMRLTRWVEFSGYGGMMRIESKFIQTLPVDPNIAALLGLSAPPQQIVHRLDTRPNFAGRISRSFRNGVVYASISQGINPGNGVFQTSYATTATGGYNYTGLRRWSAAASADFTRAESVGILGGKYNGYGFGGGLSRLISHSLHFTTSVRARSYGSPAYDRYGRFIYEFRTGIGYSPGEVPLRIW
jgi:hypothetical protein